MSQKFDQLSKQKIVKLSCDLASLYQCLKYAFSHLDEVENKDVIVAIGNTGCGKSTMLNSLIHGCDAMYEKEIEEKVTIKRGKSVSYKAKIKYVIDVKKEAFDKKPDGFFGIGHSLSQSETFMPTILQDEEKNVTWTDIAGLNDSGGDLISFINSFVTK